MGLKVIRRALRDGESRSSMLDILNDADRACDIAIECLNNMLSYEKLKAGKLVLDIVAVNAWDFISSTLRPFRMQVSQSSCKFMTFICALTLSFL